jgi:hypothetical protein
VARNNQPCHVAYVTVSNGPGTLPLSIERPGHVLDTLTLHCPNDAAEPTVLHRCRQMQRLRCVLVWKAHSKCGTQTEPVRRARSKISRSNWGLHCYRQYGRGDTRVLVCSTSSDGLSSVISALWHAAKNANSTSGTRGPYLGHSSCLSIVRAAGRNAS